METQRLPLTGRHDLSPPSATTRAERFPSVSYRGLSTARVETLLFPHVLATSVALWFAWSMANHPVHRGWVGLLSIAVTFAVGAALDHRFRELARSKLSPAIVVVILGAIFGAMAAFRLRLGAFPPPTLLIPFATAGVAAAALAELHHGAAESSGDSRGETLRAALVAVFSLWVISPFATDAQVGAGDALHYVRQLVDFVEQLKAGVFPVLIGKGSHAFNGDVHPLRTAPLYQYAGALLHGLAGGRGSAFAVHNLLMASCYLGSVAVTHFCLLRLAPSRRWLRFLLTLLFASSPGILPVIYSGDLVASWMTIPFLPLFGYLLLRMSTANEPDRWLPGLAVCCAVIWYGHAPIAIWLSAVAAPVALTKLLLTGVTSASFSRSAAACGIFVALTLFLFVSVRDLQIPRPDNVVMDFTEGTLQRNLEIGWQGFFRPASADGTALLHDLQISPGLWLAFLPAAGAVLAGTPGGAAPRMLLAGFGGLLLLLSPKPEISRLLWSLVPEAILLPTDEWPMQRFYPILTAFAVLISARFLPAGSRHPRARAGFFALLVLGTAWSVFETRKFVGRGHATTTPAHVAFRRLLPENSTLSRYSHEYYGTPSRYFSNSTVDPAYQMRLLDSSTLEPVQSNFDIPIERGRTTILRVENHATGSARILPNVTLEPGKRYLLSFTFRHSAPSGWIILSGTTFYRDYQLPSSGAERAFGSGPESAHAIVMATSGSRPESIEINYLWNSGPPAGEIFERIEFGPEASADVPFKVTSLIPFRAELNGVKEGFLLTPRIFLPGYVAHVDGREVETRPNPRRMLMVPVGEGAKQLVLRFVGTPFLRISFWISLAGWVLVAIWLAIVARRTLKSRPRSMLAP